MYHKLKYLTFVLFFTCISAIFASYSQEDSLQSKSGPVATTDPFKVVSKPGDHDETMSDIALHLSTDVARLGIQLPLDYLAQKNVIDPIYVTQALIYVNIIRVSTLIYANYCGFAEAYVHPAWQHTVFAGLLFAHMVGDILELLPQKTIDALVQVAHQIPGMDAVAQGLSHVPSPSVILAGLTATMMIHTLHKQGYLSRYYHYWKNFLSNNLLTAADIAAMNVGHDDVGGTAQDRRSRSKKRQ